MVIDAKLLKKMFLSGAQSLDAKKEWINELNVFPVPDGDTGTNMTMTIMSAVKELVAIEEDTMENVAKAVSSGALRGARGNSGVILSQLCRGFVKSIREKEVLEIPDLVEAINKAVESAYKAVMKPKEGTILTVARGMSDKAAELAEMEDMEAFLRALIECGDEVLAKTPEMLPVLKQAGVVDSGGQGLMVVLKGAFDAFMGKEPDMSAPEMTAPVRRENITVDTSDLDTSDIKFGYCTEFIIKLSVPFSEDDEDHLKEFLNGIGDSIVCVWDDDIVKIHVHTNEPGNALQKALTYGQLSRIKIDNMREEHEERLFKDAMKLAEEQKAADEAKKKAEPRVPFGFVSVCAGDGLAEIFREVGVDHVIEGGQTMNPSTEDILSAIDKVNADTVFVLPNNKNIVMAANQAAALTEDKNVVVIPSATVCQGISCMLNFSPDMTAEENAEAMKDMMSMVKTIEVTYAVRDTMIDDVEIHKDDYMAIGGGKILANGKDLTETVKAAVDKAVDEDSVVVSLYYGSDVTEDEASAMAEAIAPVLKDAEASVAYGGQPVYYYIISVE